MAQAFAHASERDSARVYAGYVRSAWRDGWRGWAAAGATAAHALMKHLVLLEESKGAGGGRAGDR